MGFSEFSGIRLFEEGLFRGLSAHAREILHRISKHKYYHPGDLLIEEGEIPSELSILVEGHAILVAGRTPGNMVGIRNAAEHEIFGITEMIGSSTYRYSLRALSPCRVDTISKSDFETFLRNEKLPRSRLTRILGIGVQLKHRIARSIQK